MAYRFVILVSVLTASVPRSARAASTAAPDGALPDEPWDAHFQATAVSQYHPAFRSPYAGENSLSGAGESKTSLTATAFLGARLWPGAQAYLDPELSGGSGFSHTQGVAGFPNGEIYRVSSPSPKPALARLYLRQAFGLGQGRERIEADANQLAGMEDSSRIAAAAGRFSLNDFFDGNAYSHDPRTQFLNWSLMDFGAWDYAADTKGYTWGAVVEFRRWGWSMRWAEVLVPKEANGLDMDKDILHAHGDNAELERDYVLAGRPGAVRILAYVNHARMGSYRRALEDQADGLDIARSRRYSSKAGFGLGLEQALAGNLGLFGRLSWNDGRNESWAFTEIDRSATLGLDWEGPLGNRARDHAGLAGIANGLSDPHWRYLAAGGYGFIIGDGALAYAPELIAEAYYLFAAGAHAGLTADFQEILHPAYNRARGPVPVLSGRAHFDL